MVEIVFLLCREIKKGEIIGVTVSSTIYIQGEGANAEREKQLNKDVGNVFKNVKGNVSVAFNIKYKYDPTIKEKNLKQGENLLNFTTKITQEDDRSHVKRESYNDNEGVHQTAGKYGEIYKNDWNSNNVIFHETGHLMGLSDRYAEKSQAPFPYYDKDLMGNPRKYPILGDTHYQAFIHHGIYLYMQGQIQGKKQFLNQSSIDLSTKGDLYPDTPLQMQTNPF